MKVTNCGRQTITFLSVKFWYIVFHAFDCQLIRKYVCGLRKSLGLLKCFLKITILTQSIQSIRWNKREYLIQFDWKSFVEHYIKFSTF